MSKIIEDAKSIDTNAAAQELLTWLIANVENYIDNDKKIFRIDLIIDDSVNEMPQLKKLQGLYKSVPDDLGHDHGLSNKELDKLLDECVVYRETLNKVIDKIHEEANKLWTIKELYNRMAFYFEKIIPDPNSYKRALEIDIELKDLARRHSEAIGPLKDELRKVIEEKIAEGVSILKYDKMDGNVRIESFEYEAFDISVESGSNAGGTDTNGNTIYSDASPNNGYVIPEGFSIELSIAFESKKRQTSLF
jgi:hypothetical protein